MMHEKIVELSPWFHNLHLPDGSQTAPDHSLGDFPSFKWREIAPYLPADLSGWTALDVGCNAGFYSFELARRGAQVTGIDMNPHYLRQARWAAMQFSLQERVVFYEMQIYDLAALPQSFDLVLFMGTFYHLRYPLLALDIVSQKVHRCMVFQTLSLPGQEVCADTSDRSLNEREHMLHPGWPKMAFVEGSFANDPTNWWIPNHACIEALLRSSGMKVLTRPGTETYICAPDAAHPSPIATWDREEYLAATGLLR